MINRRTLRRGMIAAAVLLAGCGGDGGGDNQQSFALGFAAVDQGTRVGCGSIVSGVGPLGTDSVEISDLRFFVSNVRFSTADGGTIPAELDASEFQYIDAAGSVALVDLTGTDRGACSGEGLSFPEGTARTNATITGRTSKGDITGVSFDVGIPQHLMKVVLANHTTEDAPSPLAELHWSWAFAYRFFVMNFTVQGSDATRGEGYVHVGSTDCGGDGTRALTDRESCGNLNTPAVSLSDFDPARDMIAVDVRRLLAQVDMQVTTDAGVVKGAECHSSTSQPDCRIVFRNLGVDMDTGSSEAAGNRVFSVF